MKKKLKVALVSHHYYGSRKKAGFHFLAEQFDKKGHEVTFITGNFSLLSLISFDNRIKEKKFIKNIATPLYFGNIKSIININALHPTTKIKNNLINKKLLDSMRLNKVAKESLDKADIAIFESDPSLKYFNEIDKKNKKTIYRVSDSLKLLGMPKCVLELEKKISPEFDLISCPNEIIKKQFKSQNTKLHYHGIDKFQFDSEKKSPYRKNSINHVFVGASYLDYNFIKIASKLFKEHEFHIFGNHANNSIKNNNVVWHGYTEFERIIPYIKFANTGLHTITNEQNMAEVMGDSLKVQQYSYLNLPIIAPDCIKTERKNFIKYTYNDEKSIKQSIITALKNTTNPSSEVLDWGQLCEIFINTDKNNQ